jgi:hypothetical protein
MELGKTCACRQIGHNQMPNLTACLPHSAAAEAQCKRDIQDLRDRKVHRLEDRIRSMVWYGCVQMVCARIHACALEYGREVLLAAARKTEQSRCPAADCSVFVCTTEETDNRSLVVPSASNIQSTDRVACANTRQPGPPEDTKRQGL